MVFKPVGKVVDVVKGVYNDKLQWFVRFFSSQDTLH